MSGGIREREGAAIIALSLAAQYLHDHAYLAIFLREDTIARGELRQSIERMEAALEQYRETLKAISEELGR